MLLAIALIAGSYATEAVHRWQKRPEAQFGFGLAEGIHPVAMGRWLEQCPAEGDILPVQFGNGGVLIYYAPSRQVWMDGRLEVHSVERFRQHRRTARRLSRRNRAGSPTRTPLPPSVRFIVVPTTNADHIEAMTANPKRFTPVWADWAGACFVRTPLPGEEVSFSAEPAPAAWDAAELDRPLALPMRPLLDVATRRRWYRQNVPPVHWRTGAALYSLGRYRLAIRYLLLAERLGLADRAGILRIMAQSHQQLAEREPIPLARDLPVDINLARALALHGQFDRLDAVPAEALNASLARLRGLITGKMIDTAHAALAHIESIPAGPERAKDIASTARGVRARYDLALARWKGLADEPASLRPAERALLRVRGGLGLIDAAIDDLRSAPSPPRRSRILLGDLYLRRGQPAEARAAYDAAGGDDWVIQMRRGLCCWAEGDLAGAMDRLRTAAGEQASRPEPVIYLAILLEQLGRYESATDLLVRHSAAVGAPPPPALRALGRQIARRLAERSGTVTPPED
ncbi:hypothetical protein LCGC14_1788510, partial [marine sediment metagenome]